jgi:hypothetical protein
MRKGETLAFPGVLGGLIRGYLTAQIIEVDLEVRIHRYEIASKPRQD